jgi:Flp pilus assembly protein TadB
MSTLISPSLLASLLAGSLAGWLLAEAVGLWQFSADDAVTPSEQSRRRACRENRWYLLFEPCIRSLAGVGTRFAPRLVKRMERDTCLLYPGSLTGAEVVALRLVQAQPVSLLVTLGGAWFLQLGPGQTIVLLVMAIGGLGLAGLKLTQKRAKRYRSQFSARLPFALELSAIMMETGGTDLLEALRTTAYENRGHPLGEQLTGLIREIEYGKTVTEGLTDWAERFGDDDLTEAVFLISTSLERGTPLEKSLRSLAEQARLKRLQRLERAAEECQVHCTWPGIVVMLACLMVVVAPFALAAGRELGWHAP